MKFLEGKTKREQNLVIGLIVALIFGGYLMTRVADLNKEVVQTEGEYKSEKKKLAKLNKETANFESSGSIDKQLKKLNETLKKERESLQAFDFKFVDLSDEQAILEQITDITLTAEKNQLRILSKRNELRPLTSVMKNISLKNNNNKNSKDKKVNAKQQDLSAANNQLKRRMYSLKLRGTFKSTYDFIKDLQSLEYGVLITKINMLTDDKSTYNGLRLIVTDITLAI